MTGDIDPEEVIDLLADEYVRSILAVLGDRGRTAPEVARRCGCSRTTVYRRLDTLVEAGLVAREPGVDPVGHHRTRYRTRPVRLGVSVCADGVDGQATRPDRAAGCGDIEPGSLPRRSPAD
jgi:DNA-binding HxlR family transcriptional regulator